MDTAFLVAAGLGGALVVCQFLASAFGVGGEHDHDSGHGGHDHDHDDGHGNGLFGLLTFRAVAAGLTFFGLGGLTARYYEADDLPALAAAAFGGVAALYAVAWVMNGFRKLKHDGTARITDAVGTTGTVYLVVPGLKAGPGKVTFSLQNRTVECEAVTAAEHPIPTGRPVRVVAVVGPNTVEVEPLTA